MLQVVVAVWDTLALAHMASSSDPNTEHRIYIYNQIIKETRANKINNGESGLASLYASSKFDDGKKIYISIAGLICCRRPKRKGEKNLHKTNKKQFQSTQIGFETLSPSVRAADAAAQCV